MALKLIFKYKVFYGIFLLEPKLAQATLAGKFLKKYSVWRKNKETKTTWVCVPPRLIKIVLTAKWAAFKLAVALQAKH